MSTVYHKGEIQIQERTGARELAMSMEGTVMPIIAHKFVEFIQGLPFLILSTVDQRGRPLRLFCVDPWIHDRH
ncbi:MAG: hypothetical protein R2864_09240 [Syntrophotaleaceae bacterium]